MTAREERLPKWAREELATLRNRNASVEERVQEARDLAEYHRLQTHPDTSRVVLSDYLSGDTGLGDEARVRFHLDDLRQSLRGDWIEVRLDREDNGRLEIRANRSLNLRMNASNTCHMSVAPW